jgi:hypothetical protein
VVPQIRVKVMLVDVPLQATVSLRSGQTVLLGGMVFRTGERCGERLLLLHAEIVN